LEGRLKAYITINGRRNRRKYILLRVFEHVAGDRWDTSAIQRALSPQFGGEFILVKEKKLRDEAERAHSHVKRPARLRSAQSSERI
jgi:hypothetical protein